jgi:galactokinase
VTAASIAQALVDRGMSRGELVAKQSLYTGVIERHAMLRGAPPEHVLWVPGRLEVFGKHTDYAGGRTLVCPVPRGFAMVASARTDGRVRVSDAWRGEDAFVTPTEPQARQAGWRNYVDVTVRRLARNFPGMLHGADIVIASDLPRASGMSSSSALVVGVASMLGRIANLPKHPAWRLNVRSGLDAAGYYACIENGRNFGSLHGDAGVGTHGGSEDHAAIVEGRPNQVSAFAFVPARALGAAEVPGEWSFVIAPSGVAARKTGEAREPYNRLSAGTSMLLDAWNRDGGRAVSLAEALRTGEGAAERLKALADRAATADAPASWLRDRLDHFIREDGRILPALTAFAQRDAGTLGELAKGSQSDAESLLGNQVPATSSLAATARERGAFASCGFGAGFGGAVWALVETAQAEAFATQWHPKAFVMRPGLPLSDLSGV